MGDVLSQDEMAPEDTLPQGMEAVETVDLAEPLEFLRFAGLALAITQRAVPGANRASRHSNQGLMSWAMLSSRAFPPKLPPVCRETSNLRRWT